MWKKLTSQTKYVLAGVMACLAFAAYALQETPVTSAIRTSGTYTSADMTARDNPNSPNDIGIHVMPVITAVTGSATMTLTIQGKTPQGTYYDVISSVPTQATTTMTAGNLHLGQGFTSTANVSSGVGLPPVYRIQHVVTGSGSTTYSIGVNRITN